MKTFLPTASATEFFKCAPTENDFGLGALAFGLQPNRQRRIAPRPAQNHFAAEHHADHRVVQVPDNRAVVHEKNVGDAAQPFERLDFIRANRLVTQVAAGGDDGETQFRQKELMQRVRRQHCAEIRIARRDALGDLKFEI
jgi:hypothetical protein